MTNIKQQSLFYLPTVSIFYTLGNRLETKVLDINTKKLKPIFNLFLTKLLKTAQAILRYKKMGCTPGVPAKEYNNKMCRHSAEMKT